MKNIYFVATLLFLLTMSSCATIFLNKTYGLVVYSDEAKAHVIVNDSSYKLPAKVEVLRSKDDLALTFVSDSLTTEYIVKPKLTTTFKYMNLGAVLAAPISYLVDLTNDKRYYYGKSVFFRTKKPNSTGLLDYITKRRAEEKGNLYLNISLPHINVFSLAPEGEERYTNAGFWGIGLGFDYYYHNRKFISLYGAAVTDFFVPVPAAVTIDGDWVLMTSTYVSLSHNHRFFEDFTIGYGISLSKNTWDYKADSYDYDEDYNWRSDRSEKKSSVALGFVFPLTLNLGKGGTLGVTYRPSFYRPQLDRKFRYEAILSFSFGCKIGLIKKNPIKLKF